jgi:hypothetical protein
MSARDKDPSCGHWSLDFRCSQVQQVRNDLTINVSGDHKICNFLFLMISNGSQNQSGEIELMAKRAKSGKRVAWTKAHERELRDHSRKKTAVKSIARSMKRTPGALRQKAHAMGLALGHRR